MIIHLQFLDGIALAHTAHVIATIITPRWNSTQIAICCYEYEHWEYSQLGMGTISLSSVSLEISGCEGGAGQMRRCMI